MNLPPPALQRLPSIERIIPPHAPGMRIGLFGGTFDPPHRAHLDACLLAMKRLQLDRVWWLVTPGNPLKNTSGLSPLADRMNAARKLANHPRIDVTGIEAVINTRYTFDTIGWLIARCPRVRFVWIMGADNLRHFHRWQKWRAIAQLIPIVVVDRPGPSLYASNSTAAQALSRFRIPEAAANSLPERMPPVWTYLHGLKSTLSSTALRAIRDKPAAVEPAKNEPAGDTKAAPKTSTRKAAGKKKSRAQSTTVAGKNKKKAAASKNTAAKAGAPARAKARKSTRKVARKGTLKTAAAAKRGKPAASRRKTSRNRAR
ncbi:nicotinate-nucleotide adenylyltransferase [Undibacter mobilis]|uniref:nicotinate-nucleotide adenylyltransferase n=1 Tax=Undibacter mobilis TaxID=2292256 RepID=UPI0026AE402A